MTMTISRAAMDALQQAASDIVCHANRKEIRAILDRCTVVEPTAASAEAQEDFKGWYCANCECGVDGRNVTFSEQHDACGRYIANDRPPKALPNTPALREVTTEDIERAARAICLQNGWNPDERVTYSGTRRFVRNKDRTFVKQWELHTENARAALESFRARLSMAQGSPNQFEHECPEWDGMRIKPGMPEWDSCGCFVASGTAPEAAK